MGLVAGSVMSLLVGTARAEPTPVPGSPAAEALARANVAQQNADDARARADELAKGSGWQYKTGVYQAAEREAAAYDAKANAARAEATGAQAPGVSPAMADAQERLANLKKAGGWAWKSGAVARAQADIQELKEPAASSQSGQNEQTPEHQNKPAPKIEQEFEQEQQ
jgi:hypothetical protein